MEKGCHLCPRECGAKRDLGERGYCRMGSKVRVARAALHPFEEPPISGTRGSGTVFFTGCSLGCIFCQNKAIRPCESGRELSEEELAALFLFVQGAGAHNVNLVTPTHFADRVAAALRMAKPHLHIPVVYNCGGYERVETLRMFSGLVDVYLPDFKYVSPTLSASYSAAPDYAKVATKALSCMYEQVGAVRYDADGMLKSGITVRHLVLPGCREDSVAVLDAIAKTLPVSEILLSLMRQYTPDFAPADAPRNLRRRLTSFEYDYVMAHAQTLGFEGFFQGRDAASAAFTPNFEERDLLDDFLNKCADGAK